MTFQPGSQHPTSVSTDPRVAADPGNLAHCLRLVVGCGYLGERIARRWRAAGSRVIATTRREARGVELRERGITPAIVDVTADGLVLREAMPGFDPAAVQAKTEAALIVAPDFREMEVPETAANGAKLQQ